jgi:F-type H+-transporting ATPase subunit b
MRTRKLLLAALLTMSSLVVVAGPAHAGSTGGTSVAQETPTTFATDAEKECAESLAKGGSIDDCQKAPSPILPQTNEIIWGALSFLILLFLMWKFAVPALKNGMEARTDRIRGDLVAADEAKSEAQQVLDDYRAQLADAKNESSRIIEEARQQADALKKDQEQRLQDELAEMRARATADVEAAKVQAIADLRTEVSNLAIGAAEVVVQRNLDRATQSQLVENYINQVGSRAN